MNINDLVSNSVKGKGNVGRPSDYCLVKAGKRQYLRNWRHDFILSDKRTTGKLKFRYYYRRKQTYLKYLEIKNGQYDS